MNGTLQTMNGHRWRGTLDSDEAGYLLTGVPLPVGHEVVGLPVRTVFVPWHNVSHVDFETEA